METNVRSDRGVTVVALRGEFTWPAVPEGEQVLLREATPKCKIVLDMSGVSFMGSAGLRLLLSVFRQAHDNQGRAVLVGLCPEVRELMELTGFLTFFQTFATVDDAIAALNS